MSEFGERVNYLLLKRGRKMTWLAQQTGFSPATIYKATQGLRQPSGRLINAIAKALDVSPDYLIEEWTERKVARWEECPIDGFAKCSSCGEIVENAIRVEMLLSSDGSKLTRIKPYKESRRYLYCPYCGAVMDGGDDE